MTAERLSPDEARRYARHLVLKDFGGPGQQRLKASRVLVVGAGGLGAPVILYLAAAGIGTLGIADDDRVALSNLQRQVLFGTADIGGGKAALSAAAVSGLNPHVALAVHDLHVDAGTIGAIVAGYDIVVDGTDDLPTRRVVAAAARERGVPLVSGAVSAFDGQLTVFPATGTPSFGDLYPASAGADDLPSCEATGVIGPLTGIIGTLMAMEVLKLAGGFGEPLVGRLLLYDGRAGRFTEIAFGG